MYRHHWGIFHRNISVRGSIIGGGGKNMLKMRGFQLARRKVVKVFRSMSTPERTEVTVVKSNVKRVVRWDLKENLLLEE